MLNSKYEDPPGSQDGADRLLSRLSTCVAAQMGLNFPPSRWGDLARGIAAATQDFGFTETAACLQWLVSCPWTQHQIDILAAHLTVGETSFFRDKRSFEILASHILPAFMGSRCSSERLLRIWSVGCCTGEEPYSIAILLSRLLPAGQKWHVTILATDINSHFLYKASQGLYAEWSFRHTPQWLQRDYFTRTATGQFAILPDVRQMVQFAYHNIAVDTEPTLVHDIGGMDVIVCCHVQMYLAPRGRQQAMRCLSQALVEGGWLIVSPAETSLVPSEPFAPVWFPGAVLYRKAHARTPSQQFSPSCLASPGDDPAGLRVPPLGAVLPADPIADLPCQSVVGADLTAFLPALSQAEVTPAPVGKRYRHALTPDEQGHDTDVVAELGALLDQGQGGGCASVPAGDVCALLARLYANHGNLREALTWCDKAVAADKLDPSIHHLRAVILHEQGRLTEAVTSLQRALYLDPHFVLAHIAMVYLTRRLGKVDVCARHVAQALSLLHHGQSADRLRELEGMTAAGLADIMRSVIQRVTL